MSRAHTVTVTKDELVQALMEWRSDLFPDVAATASSATLTPDSDNFIFTLTYSTEAK